MKRVLERTKPKGQILESLVKEFYTANPEVDKAMIEIKPFKMTRSDAQNDLYWAWLTVARDEGETGYTKDELHRFMRSKFLGYEETKYKNEVVSELRSTRKLKVKEFSEYIDEVDRFFAEYGIILPRDDTYYLAQGIKR